MEGREGHGGKRGTWREERDMEGREGHGGKRGR